jgi:hypothetical protein
MKLYHYSEDPTLTVFHPHVAKTSAVQNEPYVWAIDEWHSPMYYLPRQCPRACFWAGERTTADDRDRWLHGLEPSFVMAIENGWLDRIRDAVLYRYEMPAETFTPRLDDSGHYVSRETVVPVRVEPLRDLLGAIVAERVELRVVDRLGPMWRRIHQESTLHFSGTRLRNALGYPSDFGVDDPPKASRFDNPPTENEDGDRQESAADDPRA